MNENGQPQDINFNVDKDNLYREESITDLKVASIRRLVPINADGNRDESRTEMFIGHTQLMSPQGPVPIQGRLEANSLAEAMNAFPEAMKKELAEVIEKVKKMQEEQAAEKKDESRIIVPGR